MNKKLILSAASVVVLTVSCVSMYKGDGSRKVASNSQQDEYNDHFNKIAKRSLSFYNQNGSYKYSDEQLASAANIPVTEGEIITNNDVAFQKKLSMIESAKREIRMVYFIYQNDVSSSRLNEALIAKAEAGVKVSLMVDFITNYS